MKKVLSLLMALALVVSLAACGGQTTDNGKTDNNNTQQTDNKDNQNNQTTPTDQPAAKKVVNLIETSNIPTMVSWLSTDSVSFGILGNIEAGLFSMNEEGAVVPELVKDFEASEDGMTYTFHLRDADWVTVDGEVYAPVTAADFVYPIKKILDPKEASQYAFMVQTAGIKNGAAAVALSEGLVAYEGNLSKLETMKVTEFKDTDTQTAQQQFDAAKASLEEKIKAAEADFVEKYGSLEKANEEIYNLIENIGVTAVDDKTLKFELENPVPYFQALMAFPSFLPVNQKFVEEKGEKYGSSVDNLLYNGPFIFKDWKVSQRHYIEKNPKYWDADNVKLDGVDFRVIEGVDNDTVVNMYLDGQLHTAALSGENVEKYGNRPDVATYEEGAMFYIQMNQGQGEPTSNKKALANVKLRKALNMAFDKEYISKTILANGSMAADYLVPVGLQVSENHDNKDFRKVAGDLYNGEQGYNSYNVEEAKKLWAEAKQELGIDKLELELMLFQAETSNSIGTHLKNEWEKNLDGFTLVLKPLPFSEKIGRANRGDYELDFAGWSPDFPDAVTFLDMWITNGGHNNTGYSNPEYDKIITAVKSGDLTAVDKVKERFEVMVQAEKIMLEDDQVILPLYQRGRTGLRDPKLSGWKLQLFGPDHIFKYVDLAE